MTTQELEVYLDTLNKDIDEEFITLSGDYYFQSNEGGGSEEPEQKPSAKQLPAVASRSKNESGSPNKEDTEDTDFIYIMENAKMDTGSLKDAGEDDPDDPVYEFTENETATCKDNGRKNKVIPSLSTESNGGCILKCSHCIYTTSKKFLLARHMKAHSDDRPHKCSVCERGFKTNVSLLNHVNTHLGNKPHSCKSCDMCFTTSGELVRHVRYRHTGEKPHKCTDCDYASVELSKLRRHIRCHTGERPYQCPDCTYASPDTFKLKRHMRTHTGEKPYECDICHSRFTQSNSLKAHRLIHSVGDKPVFQCTLCPTTCGRKTDLRLHMQNLHHSDKPIPCKRCGQELPDRYSYKNHIKTHDGEKCYRCKICPYASISMRHLESHMLIHMDQKPYTCSQCPKAFRQQQLLNRHMNLYHNKYYVPPKPREKNHTCPHCQRAFTHKGGLMRHMETHDPMSHRNSEKISLKLGRMSRVQADGTIRNISTDYENEDDTEPDADKEEDPNEYRYEVVTDDNDDETMVQNECDYGTEEITNTSATICDEDEFIPLTAENMSKELNKNASQKFMSLKVEDGQQYMLVEVIRCDDDDDEDDDENCVTIDSTAIDNDDYVDNSTAPAASEDSKTEVENFFGFEYDDESGDSKQSEPILDMIHP